MKSFLLVVTLFSLATAKPTTVELAPRGTHHTPAGETFTDSEDESSVEEVIEEEIEEKEEEVKEVAEEVEHDVTHPIETAKSAVDFCEENPASCVEGVVAAGVAMVPGGAEVEEGVALAEGAAEAGEAVTEAGEAVTEAGEATSEDAAETGQDGAEGDASDPDCRRNLGHGTVIVYRRTRTTATTCANIPSDLRSTNAEPSTLHAPRAPSGYEPAPSPSEQYESGNSGSIQAGEGDEEWQTYDPCDFGRNMVPGAFRCTGHLSLPSTQIPVKLDFQLTPHPSP